MKKIILISLLLVFISSCSNMNNKSEKNNINNNIQEQNIKTNIQENNDIVELSKDEEKLIDDLLNF